MAACAAQAYRLWKDIDPQFAEQCIKNAETAYEAAKKHPDMYAPLDESVGGGPYGDDDATDEFYWAACELFLATGDLSYQKDIESSPHYLKMEVKLSGGEDVDSSGSFNWAHVAALGNLSMALNTEKMGTQAKEQLTKSISDAADYYEELTEKQGYGQPYEPGTINYKIDKHGYIWGSNSFIMNNNIVMAYAYELTGDDDYLDGVVSGMDYILGRNPMDYSYVTGYGTHAVENPHHRWWSYQADSTFPKAPNGVLVGGPNSGMQDPWVRGSGWKLGERAPAKCYMDNIEAWSVNECTINWNTPLAWVSAYLADKNGGVIVTKGSSDANANKSDNEIVQNSAAGKNQQNSNNDLGKKADTLRSESSGGWGLVPFFIAITSAVLVIECVIYFVKRSRKEKISMK